MAPAVAVSTSPRRTPSMRAPMFSPSFTTRKSLFMTRSFRPTKSGVVN
ncbi:Uncharacterised protein [Mycobacteroides abscessus subsp. abscessus]|nr:Uncharacterised protein [Mycobacteroides abscessus subsp. abscessus]